MAPEELDRLRAALQTLADPKGNWSYGWKVLCEMAEIDSKTFLPPFKQHPLQKEND